MNRQSRLSVSVVVERMLSVTFIWFRSYFFPLSRLPTKAHIAKRTTKPQPPIPSLLSHIHNTQPTKNHPKKPHDRAGVEAAAAPLALAPAAGAPSSGGACAAMNAAKDAYLGVHPPRARRDRAVS